MRRRFYITIDATTTAGGLVTSAMHFASTNGLRLAVEGDSVYCPACKSRGRIECDGPRIPSSFNGKQSSLSDDLCICNCTPPPKLIAIQESMFQDVDSNTDDDGTMLCRPAGILARDTTHDLAFEVKDAAGRPMVGYPYLIELSDGTRLEGTTDSNGFTRKAVAANPEMATLTVYAPDVSPVDPNWDR